jgi:natural product precursor
MKKIKLNILESQNLSDKEMNKVRGGDRTCTCSCAGSSSIGSNMEANYNIGANGGHSTSGDNCYQMTEDRCTDLCASA